MRKLEVTGVPRSGIFVGGEVAREQVDPRFFLLSFTMFRTTIFHDLSSAHLMRPSSPPTLGVRLFLDVPL